VSKLPTNRIDKQIKKPRKEEIVNFIMLVFV
jgi:hypothetical protein